MSTTTGHGVSVAPEKSPVQGGAPAHATSRRRRRSSATEPEYEVPDDYFNVTEAAAVPAEQEQEDVEEEVHRQTSQALASPKSEQSVPREEPISTKLREAPVSKWTTELYTISYLILFSILGSLARLGLQALTFYPGAPVTLSSVWPNFAGCLIMGFLVEDRKLFRFEWGTPKYDQHPKKATKDEEAGSSSDHIAQDLATAKKAHLATKKTIPLYIGLATGFCGSLTSFSSFIRDIFLALSNDLPVPSGSASTPRNGGYSFLALLAVMIATISLSFSGFYIGIHLAVGLEPVTPSLPYWWTRKVLDRLAVVLGWGSWIGAIILSIVPPDRFANHDAAEVWRGTATFALVFAPLGCLLRFYVSAHLNGRVPSFPLGTFAVNMLGTAVLGLAWDLAHVPEGGVIGCQVFQGIEDGFCGCLTTVSTWITELAVLRRRKSYIYGGVSVIGGLALMVAIMGGLRWSQGYSGLQCLH
ncbi:CrcB-like protein-domain-containing protein [Xylariaceae sp. FL1272]|nr:CrcB-like protein-domain-containing protein [Xylariaceae sp. FL1272]